jgi:DnaJ-class molecular chaperone
MSRTIIEKYACDDCGAEKERDELMLIPLESDEDSHICHGCVSYRIGVSIAMNPLGMRQCGTCGGNGLVEIRMGPHGDERETRQCDDCRGTGMRDFGG